MGLRERGAGSLIAGNRLSVFAVLASRIDDKAWMEDMLTRGTEIRKKAIALEREILETVNSKLQRPGPVPAEASRPT